jgi:cytochrome oxidase Cu insertion factor (SCO1/SenC/PrrC family)
MRTLQIAIPLLLLISPLSAQLPVGEPVPDVTAYDAKGEKFHLNEKLKGEYSVVVFGCLT